MHGGNIPFTLFHIGPVVALALLLTFLDPVSLILGATLLDVEPFYFYLFGYGSGYHGMLHSLIGAGLFGLLIIAPISYFVWIVIENITSELPMDKSIRRPKRELMIVSVLLGTYSHVFLDAIIHPDVNLAWPFTCWNPFLGAVDSVVLHGILILCFFLAFAIMFLRTYRSRKLRKKAKTELGPDGIRTRNHSVSPTIRRRHPKPSALSVAPRAL